MEHNRRQDKVVLSFMQILLLTLAQTGGASIMYLPGILEAGRDVWISFILASLVGYIVIYCNYLPLSLHPGYSMITSLVKYWGKLLGGIASVYYFLFFFFLGTLILSDIYFFGKIVMPETPPYVFLIFFVIPSIYAVKLGVETIARFTEFLIPIIIVVYLSLNFLLVPDLDFQNLFPVLADGIGPVLEGSIPNMNFPFAQILPIVFLYKYTKTSSSKGSKFIKYTFIAVFLTTILLLVRTITSVGAFDVYLLESLTYPPYSAIRLLERGEVVERIDALIIATFYGTTFLKFVITYFIICEVIADFFQAGAAKDYSVPVGTLLFVSMPYLIPRFDIILNSVVPLFLIFLPIFFLIPVALFFTIQVKNTKKSKNRKTKRQQE